jgi:DNA primase catalytic core
MNKFISKYKRKCRKRENDVCSVISAFRNNYLILSVLAISYVIKNIKAFVPLSPTAAKSTTIIQKTNFKHMETMRLHSQYTKRDNSKESSHDGADSLSNLPSTTFKSISPETIRAIKSHADILTVIESYNVAQFTSDGMRGKCICPFHDDHNPSMQIDKAKGIYKCFSCGAGGDVFNFVREYEYLQGNEDKMSYPAAIVKVAKDFVGGSLAKEVEATLITSKGRNNTNLSPEKIKKLEKERKERERLILVNLAAAEFYASSLVTSPKAGGARLHLYTRRIPTSLIRTFAIGYAPDAYYHSDKSKWGEGSLVEHLRTKYDFTPREIVDAGLASVTSAAKTRLQMIHPTNKKDGDSETVTDQLNYSDLIDRFRNRLMVPIFDGSGRNVLGFGGRYIDSVSTKKNTSSATYTEAKYLNTAETKLFIKKNVLFGIHNAKQTMNKTVEKTVYDDEKDTPIIYNKDRPNPSIVIVEGYFDAITLFGAGIKEVVASMGTSLTETQMIMAADALGSAGKVFLCLDNDDAGQLAMERICTSSWIWDFIEEKKIDINICSLPSSTKDPADFIEQNTKSDVVIAGTQFRDSVLKTSVCWNEWYISRIISRYDPNDASSFSVTCDKITTFLSSFPNAADRTRRAFETAGILASILSKEKKGSDGPLRLQLESDLLSMSSRKAASREALVRRIEAKEGVVTGNMKRKMMEISSGEGLDPRHQKIEMDSVRRKRTTITEDSNETGYLKQNRNQKQMRRQNNKIPHSQIHRGASKNIKPKIPPIVPHFSGFQFSELDSEWLGVTNRKVCVFSYFRNFSFSFH